MTDNEMIIKLHDIARTAESYGTSNVNAKEMREIADRFSEYVKAVSEARHKALQG